MLVLFETAAGYALFKVLKEGKLKEPDELWKEFETPGAAKKTYALYEVFQSCDFRELVVYSLSLIYIIKRKTY